jgi:hypothetical protein
MSAKQLAFLAATALAFAPLAVSAQQAPVAYQEAEDDDMIVPPFNRSVDDIEDMDLRSAAGEHIGEVEEVLLDASGQPVAVSVEIDDFQGIDDREVVFRLDQLELVDGHLVTSADKATIEALPVWDD